MGKSWRMENHFWDNPKGFGDTFDSQYNCIHSAKIFADFKNHPRSPKAFKKHDREKSNYQPNMGLMGCPVVSWVHSNQTIQNVSVEHEKVEATTAPVQAHGMKTYLSCPQLRISRIDR